MAMEALADCGACVFLAGHLHVSHVGHTAARYRFGGRSALVVQAGTATSTRGRGETNSFNVIRVDGTDLTVDRMQWKPESASFVVSGNEMFRRDGDGWLRLSD
jgi:FlaG/FlaF family flagellin (archaellin)